MKLPKSSSEHVISMSRHPLTKSVSLSPTTKRRGLKPPRPASFRLPRKDSSSDLFFASSGGLDRSRPISNSTNDVFSPKPVQLRNLANQKPPRRPVSCDVSRVIGNDIWNEDLKDLAYSASAMDLQGLRGSRNQMLPSVEDLHPLFAPLDSADYKKKRKGSMKKRRRLVRSAVLLGEHHRSPLTWGDSIRFSWDVFMKKIMENHSDLRKLASLCVLLGKVEVGIFAEPILQLS